MYRFILFTPIFLIVAVVASNATPLDDYVNTPDPNFGWKRLQTYPLSTYTLYVLNMTSQKWFDGTRARETVLLDGHMCLSYCSFVFIAIDLVALHDHHRTTSTATISVSLSVYQWWRQYGSVSDFLSLSRLKLWVFLIQCADE